MPFYQYECQQCGDIIDVRHGMFDKPQLKCKCGSKQLQKVITGCNFISKQVNHKSKEKQRRRSEMATDLRENYGIHKLNPLRNKEGKGYESVYKDIKKMGTYANDVMTKTKEDNQNRIRKKQRNWMKDALRRTNRKGKSKCQNKKKK